MARLAYRFAISSPRITASSIEASSFPELADKYRVRAVPHTVLNDSEILVGAVPESALLKSIQSLSSPNPH
jgi:thioredoxin-related protein